MEDKTVLARVQQLHSLLIRYQHSYYVSGKAEVSDLEYDKLFDELLALESKYPELKTPDSPTQRVGSDLSSDFPEVEHSIPVLSLDKAYSVQEVHSFIDKCIRNSSTNSLSFVLEEKIDGFSIVLYYKDGVLEKAVTRGNGFVGNDVTANVRTIHSVPLRLTKPETLAVRGEVFLPKEDFQRINLTLDEPYANPRNLAAGTIRRIKSSDTARVPLSMFCYEGFWENAPFSDHLEILSHLKDLGFKVDRNISCFCKTREEAQRKLAEASLEGFAGSFEDIEQDIKARTAIRPSLAYEIDGLVLKVNEIGQRDLMGWTEHHPKWAMAYKFEAPQAQAVVESIDVQVGRTGRITPMARISATELSGSVIKNITLHNQDYVDSLELAVGDTVEISKRGDVIPAVESVIEKNNKGNTTWSMPQQCPVCSSLLIKKGAHTFCSNHECPAREKGSLDFFCAKKQMDIEGLGTKTLEILYDKNYIRRIQDIFTFDWNILVFDGVEGFGVKKTEAISKAVKEAVKAPFTRVLVSLGIPEFGKKAVELVTGAGFDSMEKLLSATEDQLSAIDGIGPVTAHLIVDSLHEENMLRLIKDLEGFGLSMSVSKTDEESPVEQIFAGQSWCVTGTFENFKPREKAMEEIVRRGGTEVSSVSSKTTCLLAGANAGSKLQKAVSLGVRVVGEEEFLKMLNGGEVERRGVSEEPPGLFD